MLIQMGMLEFYFYVKAKFVIEIWTFWNARHHPTNNIQFVCKLIDNSYVKFFAIICKWNCLLMLLPLLLLWLYNINFYLTQIFCWHTVSDIERLLACVCVLVSLINLLKILHTFISCMHTTLTFVYKYFKHQSLRNEKKSKLMPDNNNCFFFLSGV